MATKKPQPRSLPAGLFGRTANAEVLIEVKLSELKPNPHQPRKSFDPTRIDELATSIKQDGLLQPISVVEDSKGGYIIVLGARRPLAGRGRAR